jgi:hypothetical protein
VKVNDKYVNAKTAIETDRVLLALEQPVTIEAGGTVEVSISFK